MKVSLENVRKINCEKVGVLRGGFSDKRLENSLTPEARRICCRILRWYPEYQEEANSRGFIVTCLSCEKSLWNTLQSEDTRAETFTCKNQGWLLSSSSQCLLMTLSDTFSLQPNGLCVWIYCHTTLFFPNLADPALDIWEDEMVTLIHRWINPIAVSESVDCLFSKISVPLTAWTEHAAAEPAVFVPVCWNNFL